MPIMRPEIQQILRKAGLEKEPSAGTPSETLASAGLSLDRVAENLQELSLSGNEAVRLKANEMALRVHGALKEQVSATLPSFVININPAPGAPQQPSFNPIILPRQSLSSFPSQTPQAQSQEQDSTTLSSYRTDQHSEQDHWHPAKEKIN